MKTTATIRRGFVPLGDDERTDAPLIHYYVCGSGPPLVLLHPSPASARQFLPLLPRLARHVTAIAIDTPGYGYSDGFVDDADDLQPYVRALHRFQIAIGAEKLTLYGSATGTQIAIEFAKRYPEACHALILDNIGDFPVEERERIVDGYFPDLSPDNSGSHLTRIWTMALDVTRFFPWHDNSRSARLPPRPVDPAVPQSQVSQFLQAGRDYHKAYRPAFMNERAEALLAVTTATTVIRSSGSIIKRYADRLDNHDWPGNITMLHCGATLAERADTAVSAVRAATAGLPNFTSAIPASRGPRQIVTLPDGNVFVRRHDQGDSAWLILHDIGESTDALHSVIASIRQSVSIIAPDLPGHGASDAFGAASEDFIECCNRVLIDLLGEIGLTSVSILAIGHASAVAFGLRDTGKIAVDQILLYNPLTSGTTFDVTPKIDGSHLTALWQRLRNDALYFPADHWTVDGALQGETKLDAAHLTQKTLDLIRCADVYPAARARCSNVDIDAARRAAQTPVRIYRTMDSTDGDRSCRDTGTVAEIPVLEGPEAIPASSLELDQ